MNARVCKDCGEYGTKEAPHMPACSTYGDEEELIIHREAAEHQWLLEMRRVGERVTNELLSHFQTGFEYGWRAAKEASR